LGEMLIVSGDGRPVCVCVYVYGRTDKLRQRWTNR